MTAIALVLATALIAGESYRTEVVFLQDLPAARALALHERLMGQSGESAIVLGRQPNVIVVKDTPERLLRFRSLLAIFDRKGAGELHIYVRPVQHLVPSELAALVEEVLASPEYREVRLVPDDRTQQLVAMARPETYRSLDRVLRRLDVAPRGDRTRAIRVTPAPADGDFPP